MQTTNIPKPPQNMPTDHTLDSQQHNEESGGTYSGILGKRIHHETSADALRHDLEGTVDGEGLDSSERRERRYPYLTSITK